MVHNYTYPVIDRALSNSLVFVFMLMILVTVATSIGIVLGAISVASIAAFLDKPFAVASVAFSWY